MINRLSKSCADRVLDLPKHAHDRPKPTRPPQVSSLCSMTSQTRVRVAGIAIAIAIVIGVVAAIVGNWFVVVIMVLAVLGQVVSLRADRRRLGGRRDD